MIRVIQLAFGIPNLVDSASKSLPYRSLPGPVNDDVNGIAAANGEDLGQQGGRQHH